MNFVTLSAVLVMVNGLAWSTRLALGPNPWPATAVVVIGGSLILCSTVGAIGLVVARARWARRYSLILVGAGLLLALKLDVDPRWWIAVAFSTTAGIGLVSPFLRGQVRLHPSGEGPPVPVVILPLMLLAAPGLLATTWSGALPVPVLVGFAICSYGSAFWVSQAFPGAVWLARFGYPLITVTALAFLAGAHQAWLPVAVLAAIAVASTVVAWNPSLPNALQTGQRTGSRVTAEELEALEDRGAT